jgi:AcrR family transcriptional regulator
VAGPRGTRTRPLRSETRRRVLDAAAEVFAARGIASSSVSDIAAAAGLTKGAVYSNFDSKDELVLALMEEHVLRRLHNAMAAFDAAEDVGLAVHDLGASLVEAIHSDLTWQHLLFEYCGLARRDPALHAALGQRRREGRAAVARAIERIGRARGVPLPMTPDDLAVAMLAISNGLALETGMDADGVPDDLFPRLIALIVDKPALAEPAGKPVAAAGAKSAASAKATAGAKKTAAAKSVDAKSVDAKSADAKSADAKSAGAQSVGAKSAVVRSAGARSAGAKSAGARSAAAKPDKAAPPSATATKPTAASKPAAATKPAPKTTAEPKPRRSSKTSR